MSDPVSWLVIEPAEQIAQITEGRVRLALDKDEIEQLGEYEEPPPS
jgi:hypothetical protein